MRSSASLGRPLLLAALAAAAGCSPASLPITAEPLPGVTALQGRNDALASDPPPPTGPLCGTDAWTTYGHDNARTSASGGCVFAPLRVAWTFVPRSPLGMMTFATHVVGDPETVFVSGADGPSSAIWRVGARDAAPAWVYSSGDGVRESWPTSADSRVYLADDGVNVVDAATGKGRMRELDAWGENLSDGAHLFVENNWYLDGYGLYVSAFDLDGTLLWRRDYNALVRSFRAPDVGGLALAGGRLVHSAQHGGLSGTQLSAFDPQTSERLWTVATSPQSSPSLADGRVFTLERWKGEHTDRLVARLLSDGTLVWARELAEARGPAPVLAGRLVIVHARGGVYALDQASGQPVWSTALPRTAQPVQLATTLAAAMGSRTLVVLSGKTVHVIGLDDGGELWSGTPVAHAHRLESPTVIGESLYVVADGHVLRMDGEREAPR